MRRHPARLSALWRALLMPRYCPENCGDISVCLRYDDLIVLGAIQMNSYKFYLKDRENVIVGSGGFDAEDSDTAINIVRVRSAAWPLSCHSYELLQDDRVIYCESLPPDTDMQKRH